MAAVIGKKGKLGLDPYLLLASHTFSILLLKVETLPSVQTVNTLRIIPSHPLPSAAVALSAKVLQVLAPSFEHLLLQLS